jgi:NADH:ubiquinone oxidoreductase subunit 2 (subunit N)
MFNMLMSVISFFYYLRLIKLIFFNRHYYWFNFNSLDKKLSILLLSIVIFNILFFLDPSAIIYFLFKISFFFFY